MRSFRRNRLPYLEYRHRDGYRLGNTSESSPGHRGRSDHNRCGYVCRTEFRLGNNPSRESRGGSRDNLGSPLLL